MNIDVPKKLADKLQAIADRSDSTVESVLTQLLAQHESLASDQPGSFAALAQSALSVEIGGNATVDTATCSRDILSREYADYLKHRNRGDNVSVD